MKSKRFNQLRNSILGFVIGDAVGVPYEFRDRDSFITSPAKDMIAFGTHSQPLGTWSDDSSMMFILMEWLINVKKAKQNLAVISRNDYLRLKYSWNRFFQNGYWTPHGKCFDIGMQTRLALSEDVLWGDDAMDPSSQGNGALMRILPFCFLGGQNDCIFENIMIKTCEITHGSPTSNLYCHKYHNDIKKILQNKIADVTIPKFTELPKPQNGWAPVTYESAKYIVSNLSWNDPNEQFKNAILDAINLGGDTDTVAAIAGGMIGAMYVNETDLPQDWLNNIVELDKIEKLILDFYETFYDEIEA